MATCEMCGYMGELKRAIVEGSMLNVCQKCLKYGDAIEIKNPPKDIVERRLAFKSRRSFAERHRVEDENIVSGYGMKVRKAREKMGKTQEDVAKAIAERVSVIQKVESGGLEPPLKLAKKFEQYFKIDLVKKSEKIGKETIKEFNMKSSDVTIGDMIKFKKKS
ncbi:TIGR00270 family protein [archaeon]|jgi:putative transcription factor|nr:TIGR00270 family protein [archaeon]MBT3730417.1 TIGR00270 family protein [archaeon]MBT4670400.1 TIGR00270 family protein [archaeon]MBT5030135.1 TIGR00270 family protein [archaeon]MBT5288174.1 TIGR00270 family protein [archaeon]